MKENVGSRFATDLAPASNLLSKAVSIRRVRRTRERHADCDQCAAGATLRKLGADVAVLGECEEIPPRLVPARSDWADVPSVAYATRRARSASRARLTRVTWPRCPHSRAPHRPRQSHPLVQLVRPPASTHPRLMSANGCQDHASTMLYVGCGIGCNLPENGPELGE